jgi:hypothetical protein
LAHATPRNGQDFIGNVFANSFEMTIPTLPGPQARRIIGASLENGLKYLILRSTLTRMSESTSTQRIQEWSRCKEPSRLLTNLLSVSAKVMQYPMDQSFARSEAAICNNHSHQTICCNICDHHCNTTINCNVRSYQWNTFIAESVSCNKHKLQHQSQR